MILRSPKLLKAAVAALALGGTVIASTGSAEAQYRYGHYGYHHGYHGPVYRRHRGNAGAAVAAGVIGGLAVGALAAQAYRPAPVYYGRPVYHARPVYYDRPVRYVGDCTVERRVRYNRFGERVVTRVEVCD